MLWSNPLVRSVAASVGFLTFTLVYLCFVSPRWVLEESQVMRDHDSFLSLVVRTSDVTQKQRLQLLLDTWILAVDRENRDEIIVTSSSPLRPVSPFQPRHTWKRTRFLESNCTSPQRQLNQCCQLAFGLTMAASFSSSLWTCHFDDDSFVNVFQLKSFLFSLSQSDPDAYFYVGRNSVSTPRAFESENRKQGHPHYFYFATGGAGICINRPLHQQMLPFLHPDIFTSLCKTTALSDDVLLGYLVSKHFNTKLTISNRFHSHLEPLSAMKAQFLDQQISLSYDTQSNNLLDLNSVTESNSFNDDSTGFQWLTCAVYGEVGDLNCATPNITQSSV